MNKGFLLTAAAVAALSLAACNRPEGGSEKEKNQTGESGNSSAEDERRGERDNRDERRSEESTGGEEEAREETSRSDEGEEFGANLRRAGRSGGGGSGDEAELRDALRQAAREQQARLPLRDGITTVYDVEADGTEFIVSLRISEDFSGEQFERLERAFQRNSCSGDSAELIRLGATTTYRVTDSEGERRSFSFDSCPGE